MGVHFERLVESLSKGHCNNDPELASDLVYGFFRLVFDERYKNNKAGFAELFRH